MGAHILEVLRQGLWASLTGGWFYDPHMSLFCNTFHLYLWLFLFIFPFVLHMTVPVGGLVIAWSIYCIVIGISFSLLKVTNYSLHNLFDTTESEAARHGSQRTTSQTGKWSRHLESPSFSLENIELEELHMQTPQVPPLLPQSESPPNPQLSGLSADVAKILAPTRPAITSLEDITSMEDITSLEDLKGGNVVSSPDRVKDFRETVKAMSTQVTPQTSPLLGRHRRALSHDRWPMVASTTPPVLKRQQPHYHSQRVMRRRNAVYRRRSKSVLDSPHGSHMLGECRAEEQRPVTLEWAGYPHPSPRPRHKHRKMSLEEPLHVPNKRYSLDLKYTHGRTLSHRGIAENSSDKIIRTESQRLADLKAIKERLLENTKESQKSVTHSEPTCLLDHSTDSGSSSDEGDRSQMIQPHLLRQENTTVEATVKKDGEYDANAEEHGRMLTDDFMSGEDTKEAAILTAKSGNDEELDEAWKHKGITGLGAGDGSLLMAVLTSLPGGLTPHVGNITNNNNDDAVTGGCETPQTNSMQPRTQTTNDPPSEVDRLRNPTPKAAAQIDPAQPSTSKQRSHHHSDDNRNAENPSPQSCSTSGSESTALLLTALSSADSIVRVQTEPVHRRMISCQGSSSQRSTTARQARYYGSHSSWGSRQSSRSLMRPNAPEEPPEPDPSEQWHYFQDEEGNWLKYTFGPNSSGYAVNLGKDFTPGAVASAVGGSRAWNGLDDAGPSEDHQEFIIPQLVFPNSFHRDFLLGIPSDQLRPQSAQPRADSLRSSDEVSLPNVDRTEPSLQHVPRQFYRWRLLPKWSIKIWLDRLSLLALLDRNVTRLEIAMCVCLAVLVSILASILLTRSYFQDVWVLFFCTVVAGCQYSLIKSVQPDAASPTHGYNNVIVYSRSFYFCLVSILIIVLDVAAMKWQHTSFSLYGLNFTTGFLLIYARDLLQVLILCLPLVFTFGLLPQVNTFMQYLLEQIELHVFGGNGTTSLKAAIYTVLHSLLAIAILYGFCMVPITLIDWNEKLIAEVPFHATFSIFAGVLVALSYHYSRQSSDPTYLWLLVRRRFCSRADRPRKAAEETDASENIKDPLPDQVCQALYQRLRNDLIVCIVVAIFVFGIHVSTVFSGNLQPTLHDVLCYLTATLGFLLHYVMSHLRKEYPWLCCSHPLLKTNERLQFNVRGAPMITWFEKMYVWLRFVEKNLLYPAVFLSGISVSTAPLLSKFGLVFGPLILVVCSLKALRCSFSDTPSQYKVLALTTLAFNFDFNFSTERHMFILNYAFMLLFYSKFYDFYLKCKFIFVYIAPWQLAWGSAFHAFAQPLSVPHSCMLFVQAAVSAILYTPLNPLLGSAIFITSYMRPIKFWEKDYNTKRVDHSTIRLASQVENNLGSDDNNLNSIFYEHLTRSLQKTLCGDLMIGRWGHAFQGDMFIMASDYLNALVHIVEMGNGLVTFQLRGLEFRGTYCQQREVEAITEGVEDDESFCCCNWGHLPHFLSLNAAFGERWLAWEVTVTMYILEGYSIADNNAASMLQVYDLRKVLLTYYVKAVIFYAMRSPKLPQWIEPGGITSSIDTNEEMASVFSAELDSDYDRIAHKVTQKQFSRMYLSWIQHCANKRTDMPAEEMTSDSQTVRLCYALSLVARRALATAAHNNTMSVNVEFFLYGLHSLFKGDFRITGPDEWIFQDIDLLKKVISPAIRMALKLHQDHFSMPDEYADNNILYDTIVSHSSALVITHEGDPDWRNAVLSNRPSLLALRHVFEEGIDLYKIIMLNRRHLSFRIIKVNRECVRGLWAGQQQELVYLRNRNPERGSIQNAKQALRNMINSSCDQPIGYPIYVSPLTTSYSGTNDQLNATIGSEYSLSRVKRILMAAWHRLRHHCGTTCAQLSSPEVVELQTIHNVQGHITSPTAINSHSAGNESQRDLQGRTMDMGMSRTSGRTNTRQTQSKSSTASLPLSMAALQRQSLLLRGASEKDLGHSSKDAGTMKELGLSRDAGGSREAGPSREGITLKDSFFSQETTFTVVPESVEAIHSLPINTLVRLSDVSYVMPNMNRSRRSDPAWPSSEVQRMGGASGWDSWAPKDGMEGIIYHKWIPCHPDIKLRSNIDRTILLVSIGPYYVPVMEKGITPVSSPLQNSLKPA